MSAARATLHAIEGRPGSPLELALGGDGPDPYRTYAPLIGPFPRLIGAVSGPAELLADAARGLPEGTAQSEAIAVRLRRASASLSWGEPELVDDAGELAARLREFGAASVEVWRADPSLLTEMRLGSWFHAAVGARVRRRMMQLLPASIASTVSKRDPRLLAAQLDAAFWSGVSDHASAQEWRRVTRGYVTLLYHRIAGEDRPGEEKLDISPARFAAHMRLLTRFRFAALSAERVLSFHHDPASVPPPRSVVITADDGLSESAQSLAAHARAFPQLFVCTEEAGGRAHWMDGEPVMDWPEISQLRSAGVAIGSHARHHRPLAGRSARELDDELAGSRAQLRQRLPDPLPIVAYPNGRHDHEVCAAAARAGYELGYTTEKGVNGAGTDPYCLRRVSVYGYDRALAFVWKALTGEAIPAAWERRRITRLARGTARPAGTIRPATVPQDVLVTLVMPAYNPRRDWLLEAVNSALGQRGCQIELIVIDDGSAEPVADALAGIEDPRLRILRLEHGGLSGARNAGAAAARGEYIRFVDCDDVLESDGTAHLLGLIAGERDVIAYGATLVCDADLTPTGEMVCRLDGSVAVACLLDRVDVRLFSMLFPRAVLEATGGSDPALRFCQDWDYSLRAFEHARVRGDETVVTRYRRHASGASWNIEASLEGERLVLGRYFERHPEHRGTSLERRSRARLRRIEARRDQRRGGRRREYALAIADALRLAPVDTIRELSQEIRALAPGLIASLARTAPAQDPR